MEQQWFLSSSIIKEALDTEQQVRGPQKNACECYAAALLARWQWQSCEGIMK
jgi:hypothetical protein